jgi:hypothetical protein
MKLIKLERASSTWLKRLSQPEIRSGGDSCSALCSSGLHTYRGEGLLRGNTGHEAVGKSLPSATGFRFAGWTAGRGQRHAGGKCACQAICLVLLHKFGNMHAQFCRSPCRHLLPEDISWKQGAAQWNGLGVPYHASADFITRYSSGRCIWGWTIGLGNAGPGPPGHRVIAVDISRCA